MIFFGRKNMFLEPIQAIGFHSDRFKLLSNSWMKNKAKLRKFTNCFFFGGGGKGFFVLVFAKYSIIFWILRLPILFDPKKEDIFLNIHASRVKTVLVTIEKKSVLRNRHCTIFYLSLNTLLLNRLHYTQKTKSLFLKSN